MTGRVWRLTVEQRRGSNELLASHASVPLAGIRLCLAEKGRHLLEPAEIAIVICDRQRLDRRLRGIAPCVGNSYSRQRNVNSRPMQGYDSKVLT